MAYFRFAAAVLVVLSGSALAQNAHVSAPLITDSDIQLLRQDLQSEKNTIIDHTMDFTKPEAAAFWPVYREYVDEQQAIGKKRLQLMTDYAQNFDSLTDPKAQAMTERLFAIEGETVALRKKCFPRFERSLARNAQRSSIRSITGSR